MAVRGSQTFQKIDFLTQWYYIYIYIYIVDERFNNPLVLLFSISYYEWLTLLTHLTHNKNLATTSI